MCVLNAVVHNGQFDGAVASGVVKGIESIDDLQAIVCRGHEVIWLVERPHNRVFLGKVYSGKLLKLFHQGVDLPNLRELHTYEQIEVVVLNDGSRAYRLYAVSRCQMGSLHAILRVQVSADRQEVVPIMAFGTQKGYVLQGGFICYLEMYDAVIEIAEYRLGPKSG